MELVVLERDENKIVLEVRGEGHTLLNLLREACWKEGASQASYMIEHPYLANPKIIVRGKNPKKILTGAAQLVINQVDEFTKEFKRASKA
jgi:DNA-directed RNA polymerase subunit L